MIGELERYHGIALARLIRATSEYELAPTVLNRGRSSYILDGRAGLYVKYSTNRLSPWSFSFSRTHQLEFEELGSHLQRVFLVLVCGQDGVACLSRSELARVLDDDYENVEWVKAARGPRQKYLVTGSDNRRGFRVGDNEFPAKLFAALTGDAVADKG